MLLCLVLLSKYFIYIIYVALFFVGTVSLMCIIVYTGNSYSKFYLFSFFFFFCCSVNYGCLCFKSGVLFSTLLSSFGFLQILTDSVLCVFLSTYCFLLMTVVPWGLRVALLQDISGYQGFYPISLPKFSNLLLTSRGRKLSCTSWSRMWVWGECTVW